MNDGSDVVPDGLYEVDYMLWMRRRGVSLSSAPMDSSGKNIRSGYPNVRETVSCSASILLFRHLNDNEITESPMLRKKFLLLISFSSRLFHLLFSSLLISAVQTNAIPSECIPTIMNPL